MVEIASLIGSLEDLELAISYDSDANIEYLGKAPAGSRISDSKWQILL